MEEMVVDTIYRFTGEEDGDIYILKADKESVKFTRNDDEIPGALIHSDFQVELSPSSAWFKWGHLENNLWKVVPIVDGFLSSDNIEIENEDGKVEAIEYQGVSMGDMMGMTLYPDPHFVSTINMWLVMRDVSTKTPLEEEVDRLREELKKYKRENRQI